MTKKKKEVFITTTTFAEYDEKPLDLLSDRNYTYKLNPFKRKISSKEFSELVGDSVGVIAGTENIDASALNGAKKLKVISRCGVGMENVDLVEAEKRGITTCNTPGGPTQAVAELAVGLMFNLMRHVSLSDREMRQGRWSKRMGMLLRGKTIGIIGYGSIGRTIGEIVQKLGCHVCFFDPALTESDGQAQKCEWEDLFKRSDIISLSLSFSKDNKNLIGQKELSLMKDCAYLVNCSRGGIVDEAVLYEMLKDRKIAGAAVDVFTQEPYQGKLAELDNVLLTPHIGSYAKEARIQMEIDAVNNMINILEG